MGTHPFREVPPESSGAHCVRCGRQLPRARLAVDRDGNVICAECHPGAMPGAYAADLADSMTKRIAGTLFALATIAWLVFRCVASGWR